MPLIRAWGFKSPLGHNASFVYPQVRDLRGLQKRSVRSNGHGNSHRNSGSSQAGSQFGLLNHEDEPGYWTISTAADQRRRFAWLVSSRHSKPTKSRRAAEHEHHEQHRDSRAHDQRQTRNVPTSPAWGRRPGEHLSGFLARSRRPNGALRLLIAKPTCYPNSPPASRAVWCSGRFVEAVEVLGCDRR